MSKKRTRVRNRKAEAYKKIISEESEKQQKMDEEQNPFIFKICLICIPLVIGFSFLITSKGHSWMFVVVSLLMFLLWTGFGILIGKYINHDLLSKKDNQDTSQEEPKLE